MEICNVGHAIFRVFIVRFRQCKRELEKKGVRPNPSNPLPPRSAPVVVVVMCGPTCGHLQQSVKLRSVGRFAVGKS